MSNETLGLIAFLGALISLALIAFGIHNYTSKLDPCLQEYAQGFKDATIYYHTTSIGVDHKKPLHSLKGKDYGLTD
jgi:hypothetical protein